LLSTSFPLTIVGPIANGNRYYSERLFVFGHVPFRSDRCLLT